MIKSPRAGIVNVALADPSDFSINANSQYLWSVRHDAWVMSSLVGKTTYFSTGPIRQICINPYKQGWYRFTSVLAEVCKHDTLYFQSFRGGISFAGSQFNSDGNRKGISSSVKKGVVAPIKGSWVRRHEQST